MPAPVLALVDRVKREEMHDDAVNNGRLLLVSHVNGSNTDYVAAYEIAPGECRVFAVERGVILHVWGIENRDEAQANEQAVAFTLTRNGWGEVLSGKWRVK